MNVTYHSHHGAIAESTWVFVDAGFSYLRKQSPYNPLTILEIGFGTGLNALLTLKEAIAQQQPVHYTTIETHPLTQEEIVRINHGNLVKMNDAFLKIHRSDWEKDIVIDPFFTLHKKIFPYSVSPQTTASTAFILMPSLPPINPNYGRSRCLKNYTNYLRPAASW
jgi:hypothetical protein